MESSGDITKILAAIREGDSGAEARLITLVYAELRSLARRHMRRERSDHTLQPTALVNETYLRLMRKTGIPVDRAHFFATAATVMRRVLVDHARERGAAKRGGGRCHVELPDSLRSSSPPLDQWLILDEALTQLAVLDARQARLVELVYFGGLTIEEAAREIGVAERTAKRDWRAARAWLKAELAKVPPRAESDEGDEPAAPKR
jgi:RNA polymerase sigma factor (TIGR02999 family)